MELPLCLRCEMHHSQYPDPEQTQLGYSSLFNNCAGLAIPLKQESQPNQHPDSMPIQLDHHRATLSSIDSSSEDLTPRSHTEIHQPEVGIEMVELRKDENGRFPEKSDTEFSILPMKQLGLDSPSTAFSITQSSLASASFETPADRVDRKQRETISLELERTCYVKAIEVGRYQTENRGRVQRMLGVARDSIERNSIRRFVNRVKGHPAPGPTVPLQATERQLLVEQGHVQDALTEALENDGPSSSRIGQAESLLVDTVATMNIAPELQPKEIKIMRCVDTLWRLSQRDRMSIAGYENGANDVAEKLRQRIRKEVDEHLLKTGGISLDRYLAIEQKHKLRTTRLQEARSKWTASQQERARRHVANPRDYNSYKVLKSSKLVKDLKQEGIARPKSGAPRDKSKALVKRRKKILRP